MFKVMIIDDEDVIREGLRSTVDWESIGCKIVGEASDGDDGFKMLQQLRPDIVFTDIRMPGLNGLQLISKIKESKVDCVTFIMTGFRDFEYAQEAVRLGAFRLLLKPTTTQEIMLALEEGIKFLKKTKSEQELLNNLKKKVKEIYGINEIKPTEELEKDPEGKNSTYLVNMALTFIKSNYKNDLSLKCVADELFISPWYLSKLLKKETGSTFVELLNGLRIEEAKQLLLKPQYKIYEIAEMVGFADVRYFTKLFKRITGRSPMEYKNRASIG